MERYKREADHGRTTESGIRGSQSRGENFYNANDFHIFE